MDKENYKWIHCHKDWFNLEDFCHIWIETRLYFDNEQTDNPKIIGYYAMGEWKHSGEEVIISQDWDSFDQLRHFLNIKLCFCGEKNED